MRLKLTSCNRRKTFEQEEINEAIFPEDDSEKGECGGREEGEDGEEGVIGRLKTVGGESCRKVRVLIDAELGFR